MSPRVTRYVDRRAAIAAQLRDIDEIVLRADEQEDLVVRSYLAQLAVISLSGFLEKSVEHMLNGYLEENSSFRVLSFGKRQVQRLPNMTPEKLAQLVGAFDNSWKTDLEAFLAEEERRQTLANLIGARHALAHGGATAVSPALVRSYHEIADGTVKLLLGWFLPLP